MLRMSTRLAVAEGAAAAAPFRGLYYGWVLVGALVVLPDLGGRTGTRSFDLPGAALGGLVLGVVESYAGGMSGISTYRDGIAFAILIIIPVALVVAAILVLLLCLSLAWSLDDALLVVGDGELTDFLTWTAVGGATMGC